MWRDGFSVFVLGSILVFVVITASGCISLSTFNSPQTTPKDQGSLGAGTLLLFEENEDDTERAAEDDVDDGSGVAFYPEAYGRIGLAERWDVGMKVSPFVFFADVKYQVVDADVDVAADLGVSVGGAFGGGTFAAYPAVLVGTERFFVGGRMTMMTGSIELFSTDATYSGTVPNVMVGGSIGNKIRIMPEVNVYFDEPSFLPGLGVQYRFGEDG